MSKVLLTGATGFIGSHVARQLVRQHEVHALVRAQSDRWRIADIEPALKLIEGDVLQLPALPRDFDACVHLAWDVEPGKYLQSPRNADYARASLALAHHGFPRFVAAGTCFEYAPSNAPLSESSPTGPTSVYAKEKLALFEQLPAVSAWVRFFYQYGPTEDRRRLMPYVVNTLLRGEICKLTPGEQVRDYLHVEDVAAAVCAVLHSHLTGAVNIGSAQPVTVRDIALKIAGIVGRPDLLALGAQPYTAGDAMYLLADNSKLRTTGWQPRVDLDDGLRQTIDWWRQISQSEPTSRKSP